MDSNESVSRRKFLRGLATVGAGLAAEGYAARPGATWAAAVPGGDQPLETLPVEAVVHLNQVGFLPHEPKRAVIAVTGAVFGGGFAIVDDDVTPTVRYRGMLTEYADPAPAGGFSRHFFADFADFTRPGRYCLRLSDGQSLSAPFSIGEDVYERLVPLVFRYFAVQQCGDQHSEHRGPCHLDDGVIADGPRAEQRIDVSGGWHDAGDYLKFVETTSYVAAVMLFAYDRFSVRYAKTQPRLRRGEMPVLLAQARIGLDWLLKMHPHPTEFYYQVGDESDHDSWRLPEDDTPATNKGWKPRPVFSGIGANLAGRCAAAFALASRLYRPYDPAYAARCRAAAESVFVLGLETPRVLTTKPYDFYPETTWADDMEWGAVELYKATGAPDFLAQAHRFAEQAGPAATYTSVYNVHAMAHLTLYPYADRGQKERLLDYLRADAETTRRLSEANPYGLGTPYIWGTAEAAAGAAVTCDAYAQLSGETQYRDIARRQRDFILGANPFGLCCLVGAGTRYPLFPHHQVANIKNIELLGALVGGPTSDKIFRDQKISLTGTAFRAQRPSPPPSTNVPAEVGVYHDVVGDYVTNEPANDYTVKFLLLTALYLSS